MEDGQQRNIAEQALDSYRLLSRRRRRLLDYWKKRVRGAFLRFLDWFCRRVACDFSELENN